MSKIQKASSLCAGAKCGSCQNLGQQGVKFPTLNFSGWIAGKALHNENLTRALVRRKAFPAQERNSAGERENHPVTPQRPPGPHLVCHQSGQ